MATIVLSSDSPLAAARRYAEMPEVDLKRDAASAARDRDAETLWAITRAHLMLRGRSGASISRHTLASYKTSVLAVIAAFAGTSLLSPHRDSAAVWVRTLEESGKSPGTVTVRLAGARSLYAALRWTGATTADPFQDVRPARDMTPAFEKRKPYTEDALKRLLDAATGTDRLLCLLAGHAGLRNAECLALKWESVDLDANILTVVHGKGRKTAAVPLSRTLAQALSEALRINEYVIHDIRSPEGARYRLRKLCKQVGIEPLGLHSLRHTAGSVLYRRTGKLEYCQKLLRHSDISTTQIYVHYADQQLHDALSDW